LGGKVYPFDDNKTRGGGLLVQTIILKRMEKIISRNFLKFPYLYHKLLHDTSVDIMGFQKNYKIIFDFKPNLVNL
jgi:hypothetical protein